MKEKVLSQRRVDFLRAHKTLLVLSLFALLGLLIRIHKLGEHNLWFDEFYSLKAVGNFSVLNNDYNPPLYYLILSYWVRVFGAVLAKCSANGEFILRLPSAIFGVISIPLIYRLGKISFNTETGLISAFILSISPLHIWYSQEARGYSLSVFLVMLIVYIFFSIQRKNNISLWLGFIMSSILAIYTNYFSFFIIILTGTLLTFKSNRHIVKPYLISLCLIFFSLLPFLAIFFWQVNRLRIIFWIPKINLNSVVVTLENFNAGYNATQNVYYFTSLLFFSLFILGVVFWWKKAKDRLTALIVFIFVPITITLLVSRKMPVYLDRHMMLFSGFYYIIIASGLAKIRSRPIKISLFILILIPILFCLYNYFTYQMPMPSSHHIGVPVKKPVKSAADYINKGFKKEDLVAFSDVHISPIIFYLDDIGPKLKLYFLISPKLENDKYWYAQTKELQRSILLKGIHSHRISLDEKSTILGVKSIKQLNFKRVWLISSSWARDGKLDRQVKAVREFMQNNYRLLETKEFDGIFVDLYCKETGS